MGREGTPESPLSQRGLRPASISGRMTKSIFCISDKKKGITTEDLQGMNDSCLLHYKAISVSA